MLKKLLLKIKGLFFRKKVLYIKGSENLPPPLSQAEEEELILKISDISSRDKLIAHNLRLVVYIAKRFENTGAGVEELVSIGTVGLIKAISTFNKEKNITFLISSHILSELSLIATNYGIISKGKLSVIKCQQEVILYLVVI